MARYIIEEMPDLQKTGKRITYPKFARIDNTSIKELAQRVGDVSGFSAGDIEGVLLQTAIEMAHLMAEGRSVKIDGIGTFTPSLTLATLYTQVLSDKLIQFKLCIKSIQSILKGYISWNGLALVCTPCS